MANAKYTNVGLVQYLKSKLGTPYVYGTDGAILTKNKLDILRKTYPGTYTDSYYNKCCEYIGKQTFDCSGSINSYTFDDGKNYNAAKDYSSYSIYSQSKKIVPISQVKSMPIGSILWRSGHVGTKIDDNYCIETRSAWYPQGLEKRLISAGKWTHVVLHPAITYIEDDKVTTEEVKTPSYGNSISDAIKQLQTALNNSGYKDKNGNTLKIDGKAGALTLSACPKLVKGNKGIVVKAAQVLLEQAGYPCGKSGADGIIGDATVDTINKFKKSHGLAKNGTINNKTWGYLIGYYK